MKESSDSGIIRVAAYCRVSTDRSDQANSLESQRRFFRDYIGRNPLWELYEIYVDEGLSGTNTKKRKAFNRMIADAREHRFDRIITKEISRFARNVLDSIGYTRELKSMGIGVCFLNDNINTLDPDAELRLTILSSIAQEESRKTSERSKWGQRRMMEQGVVFARDMLGYDVRGGKLLVNEEGAEIVRRIFRMYLEEGKGAHTIAKELREEGIRTSRYMKDWSYTAIMRLLKNEKYCGDLVQQKTFTPDYLTHAKKRNQGEMDFVVIRDHHEPIIPREAFDAVQQEIRRRKDLCRAKESYSNRYALSGKIRCGVCGGAFTHTIRRRGADQKRYENWSCIQKLRYGKRSGDSRRDQTGCDNVNIQDLDLKKVLTDIVAEIIHHKDRIIEQVLGIVSGVIRDTEAPAQAVDVEEQLRGIEEKKQKLLDLCLSGDIDKEAYRKGYERLNAEAQEIRKKMIEETGKDPLAEDQANGIDRVREHLEKILIQQEWDEAFYRNLVESVEVYPDRSIRIHWHGIPQACFAKVLKGKAADDQSAQEMRAKAR